MMNVRVRGLLALIALISATSAAADVVTTTYSGTVGEARGIDTLGLFGPAGADLGGDTFVAVFTTNWATPGADASQPPDYSDVVSFPGLGGASPTSAILTIGAVSLAIDGTYAGEEYRGVKPFAEVYDSAETAAASLFLQVYSFTNSDPFVPGFDYRQPLAHSVIAGDGAAGSLTDCVADTGECTRLFLEPTLVTATDAATPVPEPMAWIDLALGMVGIGSFVRRRRMSVAPAPLAPLERGRPAEARHVASAGLPRT